MDYKGAIALASFSALSRSLFFLLLNSVPEFHYCKIYLKGSFCSRYRKIGGYQFRENISASFHKRLLFRLFFGIRQLCDCMRQFTQFCKSLNNGNSRRRCLRAFQYCGKHIQAFFSKSFWLRCRVFHVFEPVKIFDQSVPVGFNNITVGKLFRIVLYGLIYLFC